MSQFYDQSSLVFLPSGYKSGKLYSQKPLSTDGELTFTRNSNATRVNADGLVEKVRTNILLQSNQFDTTWANINSTETGGQTGYDGSNDAWLIEKVALDGRIAQPLTTSGVQTASLYAKAGTLDWVSLFMASSGTHRFLYFDLANGVKGTSGSANIIDSSITSVGGGWYRITITFNETLSAFRIYPADGDGNTSGTSGNIYIQNAQLETGDIATDYIPTTSAAVSVGPTANVPRLDYSGGGCPSLLLEPQRTNLIPYSENFDNWVKQNGVSVTQNTSETLSPQGYYNADKITGNGTTGVIVSSLGSAATNTKSVYLKGVSGGETVKLKDPNQTLNTLTCNLTTEWQRFELTETQSGLYGMWIDDIPSGGIYAWGAQLEAGSYATSYIPTLGASVTKLADAASKTGIASLIGQTEGTLFVEFEANDISTGIIAQTSDGTNNNRTQITLSNELRWQVNGSGSTGINGTQSIMAGTRYKAALAFSSGDSVFYLNGVKITSNNEASNNVPTSQTQINLGNNYANAFPLAGIINQALLFKTRLTNAQLAELTAL